MSIIDKAASRRGGADRPSLVERAMARGQAAPDAAPAPGPSADAAPRPAPTPASTPAAAPAPAAEAGAQAASAAGPAAPTAAPRAACGPASVPAAEAALAGDGERATADAAPSDGRPRKARRLWKGMARKARPAEPAPVRPVSAPAAVASRHAAAGQRSSRRFNLRWEALEHQRLIGTSRHARRLQSEIRTIKSRLMSAVGFFELKRGARGADNVILVTSARPGEGKSFTAINLALSLALEDRTQVLLVDADQARASATAFFGIERSSKGLLDRLADPGIDLSEVLWRAEGSTLSVLPIGTGETTSADLYAGGAMTRLVEELSNRYPDRLVIFDAPPLLATNEPVVLSKQIRQVLMVIEAGKTTEATVRTALDVLGQRERVSLVLNHCTIEGDVVQATSYGYGYGAYYNAQGRSGRQEAA